MYIKKNRLNEEREIFGILSIYVRFTLIGNINFNYIKQITGSAFIIKYF